MNVDLRICLMMPTLNEIEGLKWCLPKIDRSLFHEIIVVDGGSVDGTPDFCREAGWVVLRQPGKGVPDAEECAYGHMTSDAFILFTPDGNSLPEVLPDMCRELRSGRQIVVGSRYLGGASSDDDDFFTGIGNWCFTRCVNILFGARFTDVLVGLRGYTREAVELMGLPTMSAESKLRARYWLMNSWELAASIRAARCRIPVLEIPASEPKRIGGVRKMSVLRNGLGGLFQIMNDFFLFHPKKRWTPAP